MESLEKTETIIEIFRIIRNATKNDVKFPSLKTTASILRLIIVSKVTKVIWYNANIQKVTPTYPKFGHIRPFKINKTQF